MGLVSLLYVVAEDPDQKAPKNDNGKAVLKLTGERGRGDRIKWPFLHNGNRRGETGTLPLSEQTEKPDSSL